jgi:hypothetical protein
MYTRPKIDSRNAEDVAEALGALVFAIGLNFPPQIALPLAETLDTLAGPQPRHTSGGKLIESLAQALKDAVALASPEQPDQPS